VTIVIQFGDIQTYGMVLCLGIITLTSLFLASGGIDAVHTQ
jgi:hypothetical protein